MANADSSPDDQDWPAVLRQLEGDRESIPWPQREAILPLDWRPAAVPTPELLAVVELLASDEKWQVRRRAAATLIWLHEPYFSRLNAKFSSDENAYVRRDADRALDKRRRGEKNSLAKSDQPGELSAEYSAMEKLYGSLPTRKARRIVEKHFDRLVGGTVHNMRGLLTPIRHYADELKDLAKSSSPSRKLVNQHAQAISARLADLEQFLHDMRAYAQPIPTQRRRERLIDLVREASDAARRHFVGTGFDSAGIELRINIPDSLTLEVARHQVLSVFTNLLRNEFEAFRSVQNEVGPFWIAVSANTDDDRVSILIEDNGIGFGDEDLQQIREFIPGYKTMKHDGTGFGLPTARRYIEAHGGTLDIDSQIQAGTKVRIVLPLEAWGEDAE
jgi:signal transduction histidine kinase